MKRIIGLLLVVTISMLLVACSSQNSGDAIASKSEYEIAVISEPTDAINIESYNQLWASVAKYSDEKNITSKNCVTKLAEKDARLETIKNAVDNGAKVVITLGSEYSETVYYAQSLHPNTQFIHIGNAPHSTDYKSIKTGMNVHCIEFNYEQAGYLAGYSAIMEGYTKLGFVGGKDDVDDVSHYGNGFIQGVEDASTKKGLGKDEAGIEYWHIGTGVNSTIVDERVRSWYSEDTEVVLACGGEEYFDTITTAANDLYGKVIAVDTDKGAANKSVMTTAYKNLDNAIEIVLEKLYGNKGVWKQDDAAATTRLGIAENCIGLTTKENSWWYEEFTQEDYNEVVADIKEGVIIVSEEIEREPVSKLIEINYPQSESLSE